MAKQKAKGLTSELLAPVKATPDVKVTSEEKPIAMTLKLSPIDYERLKVLAVKRRSKGQAIMLEAVREYLDRIGA